MNKAAYAFLIYEFHAIIDMYSYLKYNRLRSYRILSNNAKIRIKAGIYICNEPIKIRLIYEIETFTEVNVTNPEILSPL